MPAPIDFYFEFASPYGYLASLKIDTIAAAYDREVAGDRSCWGPLQGVRPVPNVKAPLRGPYFLRDVPRSARLMGAPFTMPPSIPMNSLTASRAYWWLPGDDLDIARGFAQAVFHAHWGEGRDMSTVEQVLEVAGGFGIVEDELRAAVTEPVVKERLKAETDRAIEAGVFGSPFSWSTASRSGAPTGWTRSSAGSRLAGGDRPGRTSGESRRPLAAGTSRIVAPDIGPTTATI